MKIKGIVYSEVHFGKIKDGDYVSSVNRKTVQKSTYAVGAPVTLAQEAALRIWRKKI